MSLKYHIDYEIVSSCDMLCNDSNAIKICATFVNLDAFQDFSEKVCAKNTFDII